MSLSELAAKIGGEPITLYGLDCIELDGLKYNKQISVGQFPLETAEPKIAEEIRNLSSGMLLAVNEESKTVVVQTVNPLSKSAREYASNFLKKIGFTLRANLPNY